MFSACQNMTQGIENETENKRWVNEKETRSDTTYGWKINMWNNENKEKCFPNFC